ncbi:sigma-70 family RNA polymerase sigma factor [bacterium]|nr:sigma-70 family RNA polymerase sigma factor [bacterium]
MSQDLTDRELVLAAREGDSPAYGELIHRYHETIYAFLMQLTKNRQDAEDLTQDTFLHALQKLGTFKLDRKFRPWLFTIARRLTIAQWRHHKPTFPLLDSDHPETASAKPHDTIALWQIAQSHLKRDEFMALWLHYQENLPIKEVARVLRKTVTHSKVILHRARKKLGKKLASTSDAWLPGRHGQALPLSNPTSS